MKQAKMVQLLLAHRYLYYVLGAPVISDQEYDDLERLYGESLGVGSDLPSDYPPYIIALARALQEEKLDHPTV